MKNEKTAGALYFTGAFSLAGTSVIAARVISNQLGVFTIAALSMAFALLLLIPISFSKLKALWGTISLRQVFAVLIEAFFGMFLFRFLLLNGVSRTSALEAGILTGATPAITAFLAWAVLKETVKPRALIGILSTILGVLLVQGIAKSGSSISNAHIIGNLLVVGAAASESIFNIVCRTSVIQKAEAGNPLDPILQTTLVTTAALLLCLIPAAFEQPITRLAQLSGLAWLSLVWYGVFVTALAYLCWYAGIKRSGAFTAAAFSGLMPLTSMLLSALLLREQTDLFQLFGGACVIAGMMLIGTRRTKQKAPSRLLAKESQSK